MVSPPMGLGTTKTSITITSFLRYLCLLARANSTLEAFPNSNRIKEPPNNANLRFPHSL